MSKTKLYELYKRQLADKAAAKAAAAAAAAGTKQMDKQGLEVRQGKKDVHKEKEFDGGSTKHPVKVVSDPGDVEGLVNIDLGKKDKMTVKTLPNKNTQITFNGGKRGQLDLTLVKGGAIEFTFTNSNKQKFIFNAPANEDFMIPQLVPNPSSDNPFALKADGEVKKAKSGRRRLAGQTFSKAERKGSFAIFQKETDTEEASLDIPSMRVKL